MERELSATNAELARITEDRDCAVVARDFNEALYEGSARELATLKAAQALERELLSSERNELMVRLRTTEDERDQYEKYVRKGVRDEEAVKKARFWDQWSAEDCKYMARAYLNAVEAKSAPLYGYGIVDNDGAAWMMTDQGYQQLQVNAMNQLARPGAPFRVVKLVIQEIQEKKDG